MADNTYFDGVIKSEFLSHIDEIAHKRTQPTEDLILRRNYELRKNPGSLIDLGKDSEEGVWGRQVASIPMNMFEKAIRDGYSLDNRDNKIAEREMFRYLQSEEGRLCLVQPKQRDKYVSIGVH